jgi:hypothetical protein
VDLLKCDIEGAESEVFSNCCSWIGLIKNLVAEIHPPYTTQALLSDLKRAQQTPVVQSVEQRGVYTTICLKLR